MTLCLLLCHPASFASMLQDAPFLLHYFFINTQRWTAARALLAFHCETLHEAHRVITNIIIIPMYYHYLHDDAHAGVGW